MFECELSSHGNPDWGQYAPISYPVTIRGRHLKDLKAMIEKYITFWGLGSGNWPNPMVSMDGKGEIGYFSYNRRFWRGTPEQHWKEIQAKYRRTS